MDDRELTALLDDLESDRVERKTSDADLDALRKNMCAFANDLPNHGQPGVLFIGADDQGRPAGVPVTDQMLLRLTDQAREITPFPSITVQKRTLKGQDMAVVIVAPSHATPVRLRGRVWVRVGPSLRTANQEDERRLTEKRRWRDLPFDIREASPASLDDLDLDLFQRTYLPSALAPDVLESNNRSLEQQLSSLRFTTPPPGSIPTALGLLAIGKDPRAHFPGAYIQFLRIDGQALTDPIADQREISGPLPDLLKELDDVLRANIRVSADIVSGPVEIRKPDYPLAALQQIARNAVLHRNYEGTNAPARLTWFSGRIEISSPGGPFGQVTKTSFGAPGVTDYRNPNLAEAMKNLGYVQRFGLGIPMARREMELNGNPALEFQVEDSSIVAVLRRAQ